MTVAFGIVIRSEHGVGNGVARWGKARDNMGGGGGDNPAAGMTGMFGKDVQQTGQQLTDASRILQNEYGLAQTQENPLIANMLNTATDPQQQLYNRTLQQVTDNTRSSEAARGVANTPYGAAAEGNALSNFNIDWQNNSLQRQMSGLSSATQDYGGLIQAGATAEQPAEAAMQGFANAFSTSSQAQTAQNAQKQQAQQAGMSELGSLGGSLGGLAGKGGGGT